jgi:ribulose kinase
MSKLLNKLVAALIGAGTIVAVMGFTNPQKEKYLDYASTKLADEAKESVCKTQNSSDVLKKLNDLVSDACKSGIDKHKDLAKGAIDSVTSQENMVIFSIYTTDLPNKKYKTLGILGNFFTFS